MQLILHGLSGPTQNETAHNNNIKKILFIQRKKHVYLVPSTCISHIHSDLLPPRCPLHIKQTWDVYVHLRADVTYGRNDDEIFEFIMTLYIIYSHKTPRCPKVPGKHQQKTDNGPLNIYYMNFVLTLSVSATDDVSRSARPSCSLYSHRFILHHTEKQQLRNVGQRKKANVLVLSVVVIALVLHEIVKANNNPCKHRGAA